MTKYVQAIGIAVLLSIFTGHAPAVAPPAEMMVPSTSAELVGHWQGTLAVGEARLRVVFHLRASDDGTLEATLDSPDQGATGIPVGSVTVQGGTVTLEINAIGAVYTGEVAADRQAITGEWRQGSRVFPLTIERVAG
jgi:hypothetical protein